jgi:hypothetical protein
VLREGLTDLQLRRVIESGALRFCGDPHGFDKFVGVGVALNTICVNIQGEDLSRHIAVPKYVLRVRARKKNAGAYKPIFVAKYSGHVLPISPHFGKPLPPKPF